MVEHVADSVFAESGRCWQLVTDSAIRPNHCFGPVTWTGRHRVSGRSGRVFRPDDASHPLGQLADAGEGGQLLMSFAVGAMVRGVPGGRAGELRRAAVIPADRARTPAPPWASRC